MGDLAIRIGAGSEVYKDVALAYSMRRGQKLSISGTGEDLYTALTTGNATKNLANYADGIGSIKSSSDIVLSADQVTSAKAALLKLGTRSLVLQASGGTELGTEVTQNFSALDATYTKFKSMNMTADPIISSSALNGIVNLQGMQKLSGKRVVVEATGADIKDGMAALLKNVANIMSLKVTGGTAQFTVDQLKILGDKLDPSGAGTIKLKDTADKLLQTSSINLINKLNNSYINSGNPKIATATGATTADDAIASAAHGLITGDKVTYIEGSTAIAGLVSGTDYFARAIDGNSFSLYTSKADALNVSSMDNRVDISADGAGNGNFVTSNADAPIRVTTLHVVDVTNASLAQVNQFTALTTPIAGNDDAREENRQMSSIIGNVEIKDTAAILNGGSATRTLAAGGGAGGGGAADEATDTITSNLHGYNTGDAVYYEKASGGASIGLTDKTTYYVGKVDANNFTLFTTRADALAGNNAQGATGLVDIDTSTGTNAYAHGVHSFTTSDIDKTMSAVGKYKGNSGTVERVTIAGSGVISTTDLDSIAAKVKNGGGAAGGYGTKMTYSAKAIEVQGNIQALYDNMTKVNGTAVNEIVVSDGTIAGKKTINLTIGQYNEMFDAFSKGVTNPVVAAGGNAATAPTNYAFNVTGAAYTDSKKAGVAVNIVNNAGVTRTLSLQDDKNVASFSLVGLNKASVGASTVTSLDQLRDLLSQSKLKLVQTNSQSANNWLLSEKTNLKTWLSNIGSNVDRNKLKVVV
jgi:hypothetical protein